MQVVFVKIPIDNWGLSIPEINRVTVVACHTQDYSCMARARVVSHLSQIMLHKCSKMQHILLIMDSHGGLTPR